MQSHHTLHTVLRICKYHQVSINGKGGDFSVDMGTSQYSTWRSWHDRRAALEKRKTRGATGEMVAPTAALDEVKAYAGSGITPGGLAASSRPNTAPATTALRPVKSGTPLRTWRKAGGFSTATGGTLSRTTQKKARNIDSGAAAPASLRASEVAVKTAAAAQIKRINQQELLREAHVEEEKVVHPRDAEVIAEAAAAAAASTSGTHTAALNEFDLDDESGGTFPRVWEWNAFCRLHDAPDVAHSNPSDPNAVDRSWPVDQSSTFDYGGTEAVEAEDPEKKKKKKTKVPREEMSAMDILNKLTLANTAASGGGRGNFLGLGGNKGDRSGNHDGGPLVELVRAAVVNQCRGLGDTTVMQHGLRAIARAEEVISAAQVENKIAATVKNMSKTRRARERKDKASAAAAAAAAAAATTEGGAAATATGEGTTASGGASNSSGVTKSDNQSSAARSVALGSRGKALQVTPILSIPWKRIGRHVRQHDICLSGQLPDSDDEGDYGDEDDDDDYDDSNRSGDGGEQKEGTAASASVGGEGKARSGMGSG